MSVFQSKFKYARISPRKAGLVVDLIRHRPVNQALRLLQNTQRRAAPMIEKTLKSAIANAQDRDPTADVDMLYVSKALADPGPTFSRWLPRARGRATPIIKRTTHITIEVDVLKEMPKPKKSKKQKKSSGEQQNQATSETAAPKAKSTKTKAKKKASPKKKKDSAEESKGEE